MARVPNVAVLLAGCGHVDGAEIREAVLTMLALDQHGAKVQCLAPAALQAEVVVHATGKPAPESRNVLAEAGRIARVGQIRNLAQADPAQFDALLLPGGAGVAKNLCTFARQGAAGKVSPDVQKFVAAFFEAGKPVGAICIAPALVAMVLSAMGRTGTLTLGSGEGMEVAMDRLGITLKRVPSAREIVVDEQLKLVTTAAYMFDDARLSDVWKGIERCCAEVLAKV